MGIRSSVIAAIVAATLASPAVLASTVTLSSAIASFSQAGFNISAAIDGLLDNNIGWAIHPYEVNQWAQFTAANPVGGTGGTQFTFTLSQLFPNPSMHTIGKFKLSVTTNGSMWSDLDGVTFAANPSETPVNIAANGTILLNGNFRPKTSVYTVTGTTNLAAITGFRLDVLEDPSLLDAGTDTIQGPSQGPGRQPTNGNFVLTEFRVDAEPLSMPLSASIPAPAAAWPGLALLGALATARRLRRNAR